MRHDHVLPVDIAALPVGPIVVAPASKTTIHVLPVKAAMPESAGFKRRFSCHGWPVMVRIIWWALRG